MLLVLALAFVLSGASGLIYESIWTRYLSLFVGHSAYAQIIVLVIFLGGMSLGALVAGARSSRLRQPLLWYAAVEFAVGVIGFVFHDVFIATSDFAYARLFPALAGGGVLTVVKWGLAGLLLLPQSVLLGATFPLMSAGAMRHVRTTPGRVLGLLYFTNSLGAAMGALLAGFFLIQMFGLPGTLLSAGVLNFVVAIGVAVALRVHDHQRLGVVAGAAAAEEAPTRPPEWRPLLLVSFGTAVASFVYEIGWIRMLSLVLGSATHSFELMLSSFILGLALGAYWIRGRADTLRDPVRTLGIVQCIMGALAVGTLPVYMASFGWMGALIRTFKDSGEGYHGFLLARYAICLVVMLPATFCAGITLPLITKVLLRAGAGERAIGAVYGVNTLGSIAGVILAGLVLMPLLGLKSLLIAGALVDVALGVMLLGPSVFATEGRSRSALSIVAATVMFVVANAVFVNFDLLKLTSGVFRHGLLPDPGTYTFPFYKDGRTSTVSVRRATSGGFLTLATNGKPDASMAAAGEDTSAVPAEPQPLMEDQATQVLLPLISLAHAPAARDVAVIGQGSGMTSHVLLGSPGVHEVVTVEIEPEMVNASRLFWPANRRVFDDPRSHIVIDDAKSYFASSGRTFDLIVSEPSNPWVSGVSGLFTTEFYRRVRAHLSPNGVLGQWLHFYEIDDHLALTVLAAIDENFDAYELFFTSDSDVLILASNRTTPLAADWRVLEYAGVRNDLRGVLPLTPEALEAMHLIGRQMLHPYIETQARANSDYYPRLDLGAERTRFLHSYATGLSGLGDGRFDVVAAATGRRAGFGTVPLAITPEIARVSALALGVRLRRVMAMSAAQRAGVPRDSALSDGIYRVDGFERRLGLADPPTDWRLWLASFREVERVLHGGTAGVADEAFYARVRGYLGRTGAPSLARAAVDFAHGLAAWNFAEASRAGGTLIDALRRDTIPWLPVSQLRNGTVVARMRLGDSAGATAAFKALAGQGDDTDFVAHILAADLLVDEHDRATHSGGR